MGLRHHLRACGSQCAESMAATWRMARLDYESSSMLAAALPAVELAAKTKAVERANDDIARCWL